MGCNCGGNKKKVVNAKTGLVERAVQVSKEIWNKTQQEPKPVNITKINKK